MAADVAFGLSDEQLNDCVVSWPHNRYVYSISLDFYLYRPLKVTYQRQLFICRQIELNSTRLNAGNLRWMVEMLVTASKGEWIHFNSICGCRARTHKFAYAVKLAFVQLLWGNWLTCEWVKTVVTKGNCFLPLSFGRVGRRFICCEGIPAAIFPFRLINR